MRFAFLAIYLCSTFTSVVSEGLHLVMHLGDIVSLDYHHHSHSGSDHTAQLSHHHNGTFDNSDSCPDDQKSDITPVKDKVEIATSYKALQAASLISQLSNIQTSFLNSHLYCSSVDQPPNPEL